MTAMSIDFSKKSFYQFMHQVNVLTVMLFFILIFIVSMLAWKMYVLINYRSLVEDKINAKQWKISSLSKEVAHITLPVLTPEKTNAINQAVAQLNLPWSDLLEALEKVESKDVALLHIEPDATAALINGTAEAKTSEAMFSYLRDLKKQTFFSSVILTKHDIIESDPMRPIQFQFVITWNKSVEK